MSKGPKTHHVVPNPSGGWDVKRGGADRASSHHDKKQDAVDTGREVSRGRIASSDSHSRDPYPPKG